MSPESKLRRAGRLVLVLTLALAAGGCSRLIFARQLSRLDAMGTVAGEITAETPVNAPVVVVLFAERDGRLGVIDHLVLPGPGTFLFVTTPGRYSVAAFADPVGDLVYRPGEPLARRDEPRPIEVAAGDRLHLALALRATPPEPEQQPYDVLAERLPQSASGPLSTGELIARGHVTSLDDPRFDRRVSRGGVVQWVTTFQAFGAGIYFAEPYDPNRIPVLFVHGMSGTPREFRFLSERLDPGLFQAWYYHYPSGFGLHGLANLLSDLVVELHLRHRMEHLYVVAHSMGGLVSRAFIQRHFEATGERYVTRFVSIATPWGGMRAARMARLSRRIGGAAPPSWIDIAPKSRFLRSIFSREVEGGRVAHRLPDHVAYDLLFAFGGRHSAALVQVGEPPADGVVSLASQLAAQAREEAGGRIFAVDADHTSILRSEEAATYLQRVLEGTGSGRGER